MPKIITQIEIKRKRKKTGADLKRPIDDLPEFDDPVRRRLSRGRYIRYFDLAQYANGVERPFSYLLAFDGLSVVDVPGWTGVLPSSLYTCVPWPDSTDKYGYIDSYHDYLLMGDPNDWATTYKEVKAHENTQFFADFATDYQEGKGYPINQYTIDANPGFLLGVSDGGWDQGWLSFNTHPVQFRTTRSESYAAPHFQLDMIDGDIDVFLAPSPKFWEGRAVSFTQWVGGFLSGPFAHRQYQWVAGHVLHTIPRTNGLHHPGYDTWWEWVLGLHGSPGNRFPNPTSDVKSFMYGLFMSVAGRTNRINIRQWELDGMDDNVNDYVEGGSFPQYGTGGYVFDWDAWGGSVDSQRSWIDRPIVRWFNWWRPAGMLSAIINKKGGTDPGWYYVWRNVPYGIRKPYPSAAFPGIADIANADLGCRV